MCTARIQNVSFKIHTKMFKVWIPKVIKVTEASLICNVSVTVAKINYFKYYGILRVIKMSHPHTQIFTDGCNSIQFTWINKHTILLWLYKSPCRSHHAVICSCQSRQSCPFSQSARLSFSKCNEYSLSNTTIQTWLAKMSLGHISQFSYAKHINNTFHQTSLYSA